LLVPTLVAAWLLLAPAAAAQTASTPRADGFGLASGPWWIDDHADPKGGGAVHVVAGAPGSIVVRARVRGIRRLDVALTLSVRDTVAAASGVPDADGDVAVRLPLPRAGVVYVVQGLAVLDDQSPPRAGEAVNGRGERVLPAGAFRVMVDPAGATGDARTVLSRFLDARLARNGPAALALVTDELRARSPNAFVGFSNPCFYRYAVEGFAPGGPGVAGARVRLYTHFWPGDLAGGPPNSAGEEIRLVRTATGWRVDDARLATSWREEPDEPHGPTTSACNVGRRPAVWLAAALPTSRLPAAGGLPGAALPLAGTTGLALVAAGLAARRFRHGAR
jgi:hypothetical protein